MSAVWMENMVYCGICDGGYCYHDRCCCHESGTKVMIMSLDFGSGKIGVEDAYKLQ